MVLVVNDSRIIGWLSGRAGCVLRYEKSMTRKQRDGEVRRNLCTGNVIKITLTKKKMFVNLTQVGPSNAGPKRTQSLICKVTTIHLPMWFSNFSPTFKSYEIQTGMMVSHVNFEM